MAKEASSWRNCLIRRLNDRNTQETDSFKDIIEFNNRMYDNTLQLRADNLRLSVENEQLRVGGNHGGSGDSLASQKISSMEKKLMAQQEELTELHKRKGENAQMIVDLNIKLEKQSQLLQQSEKNLAEQIAINNTLKAEIHMLTNGSRELQNLNTMVRDEHTALLLAFNALEDKLRQSQQEHNQLVEQFMKYKSKDADKMNEENETFLRKRSDKLRKDLEEAARDGHRNSTAFTTPVNEGSPGSASGSLADISGLTSKGSVFYGAALPSKVHFNFDAHDGEVTAVCWSPNERAVVTGGADRKIKLWGLSGGAVEYKGTLVGSNLGINSVTFDSAGTMILGASNDFATRVWSIPDQRLRHTLTGHGGKVMAAKFLGEPSKVVTGSHDRTLKLWDLRRACYGTRFAGSSCNDLVISDDSGSSIISGHFDKKIRFWDPRTDHQTNDILLQDKITSLDLSKDCRYLLACVRDHTIKLIDLRMSQILLTFSHDDFGVGCDWTRVSFSADSSHIAVGSADGTVFIWNIGGQLETTLKNQHTSAVTAVAWNPHSNVLASVDRTKKCMIWTDV